MVTETADPTAAHADPSRTHFYERARGAHLAPLWEVLRGLVTREPQTPAQPARWRFDEVRPYLLEAARLIGTAEAERRVLVLENPGLAGESKITRSLYAGLQIVLPGETAPAHRHMATALRFVIEGQGGRTAVDGETTVMHPGDFIVTPSWAWHEHANVGEEPVIWLDGLDIHLVNLMDTSFREDEHECPPLARRPDNASWLETGLNLLPIDIDRRRVTSPIFNYPYQRTREALDGMSRLRAPDAVHGHKMRYVNPLNGDWAMPTIATWAQCLPTGFDTAPARSTDGSVLVVVEGQGHSIIGGQRFDWGPKDVLVVPSWCPVTHHAASESVLFGASDRATQEKLGLWRERRESSR